MRGRLLRSTARSLTFAAVAAAGATATARASIEPQARSPSANTPPAEAPAPVLTRAPELLEYVPPEYPPELLASGVGGEVVLLLDLDAGGRVERVEVASAAAPELGEAARAAALQLVFSPAEIDGEPAPIRIEYRYTFTPEAPVPDAVSGESAPAAEEPVRFAGTVREAGTRRPIAGAVVAIAGRAVAETDAEGRFEVRGLLPGKIEVRITSRNHDPYTAEEEIAADERLETKYYLVRRSGDPFETVVRTRPERQEVSRVQLERQEVRKIPGTFGDPLRVIENLPGMARVPGGFGGALLVRGTPPEDSAVFIDGVQVPLLYHFGGLTSVVNAEFLERIDFFPGGFGARYGRATAGIVDVQSRELDCDAWRGAAEISAMLASGFLCAPASEWSVAAAGRRSYIDVVLPFVLDNVPREEDEGSFTASPLYWDYQVKANRQAGAHSFEIFAFGSDDRLKIIQTGSAENFNFNLGLHLGFHRVLLRHRLRLGERTTLVSSLTPGYSRQDFFQRASEIDLDSRFGLDIWSVDWREDLRHEVTDWLTLAVGLDHRMGRADLELEVPIQTDLRVYPSPVFDFTDIQRYARELPDYGQGYWVEAAAAPTPDLKIVAGLRLDRHDFHETQGFSLGPRATVRWQPFADSTLKAAYGLYQKLPDQQYLIDGIGNPRLAPERAHHIIAGFEHKLTDLVDVDVQAFYNLRQRLRSPSDEIRYEGGKAVSEVWSNDGSGRTYGIELLLRHLATPDGRFYGWIAYTLSRSVQRDRTSDTTASLQGSAAESERANDEYLVDFDQTHILTVVAQWMLPWGFEAGLRFRLTSGTPYTPLERGEIHYDADADAYRIDLSGVARNSSRLPAFHQLDLRVDKNFTFALWKLTVFLELMNAYNASNIDTFRYDYRYREKIPISLLPLVPVLGVRGEF